MRSRNLFSRRLAVAGVLCVLMATAILGRMVKLSLIEGPRLVEAVRRTTCRETVRMSYRGPILDRNGAALATSMAASRVAARRAVYRYEPKHAVLLAPLLHVPVNQLDATLKRDPRRFIWLSKSVSVDDASAIKRLGIPGIDVYPDQQRSYPQGPLAAHVLGFTGTDAQGLEGIERALEREIRGEAVSVRVCKDVAGRVFFNERDLSGVVRGATVRLTLDATLQAIAEAELNRQVNDYQASGGTVVILQPRTGEILAMANAPAFDPNRYTEAPKTARRNRAVTDVFEPGSTAKALLMAAALDAGAVTLTDSFFCENGSMRVGGWTIHDHHPHGTLTVPEILKVSSNICSAKIGALLGAARLGAYLRAFGFGRATGAKGLIGEVRGLMAPESSWRAARLANVSFGQGVSVTALQLASAFATLANDGVRMKPYLVREVRRADGELVYESGPEEESRVVSIHAAREVTRMLESVVSADGTAPQAAVVGIRVAGKTGTAQKVENGRYSRRRWVASFVGYLPAEDPQLVISVVIDEPQRNHYGGVVAAPVFRRIAEASVDYLHIRRSLPPLPRLTVEARKPEPLRNVVSAFAGTMPDVRGMSLRTAVRALDGCGCDVHAEGYGRVVEQEPEPGAVLARHASVRLRMTGAAEADIAGAGGDRP